MNELRIRDTLKQLNKEQHIKRSTWVALALKNDSITIGQFLKKKSLKISKSLRKTFSKKKHQRRTIYVASAIIIFALSVGLGMVHKHSTDVQHRLTQNQLRLKKTSTELKQVQQQKAKTEAEVQAKAAHEADLQKQIDDLNKQLQAKKASQLASAVQTYTPPTYQRITTNLQPQAQVVAGCGDNTYANFIYMHESGCSTYNPNTSSGACGLGQAWPCSKLMAVCPNMDYACENAWFNGYASSRYGGWAQAYDYWLAHRVW